MYCKIRRLPLTSQPHLPLPLLHLLPLPLPLLPIPKRPPTNLSPPPIPTKDQTPQPPRRQDPTTRHSQRETYRARRHVICIRVYQAEGMVRCRDEDCWLFVRRGRVLGF